MPNVKLINYTGIGHPDPLFAARMLAYSKNTRLNMTPDGLETFMQKPAEEIMTEIDYMAGSIPSAWEMVELTFAINQVSRATAQQITRSRVAVFQMQSQRVTDMSAVTWNTPPMAPNHANEFNFGMRSGIQAYKAALQLGITKEDARDLLPMGVHCNLLGKYNLRSLVEMSKARDSLRVQGPYREVLAQMKTEVLKAWPWASAFFVPKNKRAIDMIERVAKELQTQGGAMYSGHSGTLAKAADLLKGE